MMHRLFRKKRETTTRLQVLRNQQHSEAEQKEAEANVKELKEAIDACLHPHGKFQGELLTATNKQSDVAYTHEDKNTVYDEHFQEMNDAGQASAMLCCCDEKPAASSLLLKKLALSLSLYTHT